MAICCSCVWFSSLGKPVEIVAKPGSLNQLLLQRLPTLERPYRRYPFLLNRHQETIFAATFRSLPHVTYRRECLRMADGGTVALDWPVAGEDNAIPATRPVLILLPGLTGGSGDTYVQHLLLRAKKHAWHVVVFNSRGCANSPVTSPKFYSASFTEDLHEVVKHVHSCFPQSRVYAAGWSLGGNILIKYIGQEAEKCSLTAAVSLCNPFNLVIADEEFWKGFNNIYNKALARTLRKIFKMHAALFHGISGDHNIPKVLHATSVRDFDDGLTRVSFGYKSVDEYYYDASSSRSIKDVKIPLLCIQANDDPIAPSRAIPLAEIKENENCLLIVTPTGGHLGWVAGDEAPFGAPWTDPLVIEYLEAIESLNSIDCKIFPKNSMTEDCKGGGRSLVMVHQWWHHKGYVLVKRCRVSTSMGKPINVFMSILFRLSSSLGSLCFSSLAWLQWEDSMLFLHGS